MENHSRSDLIVGANIMYPTIEEAREADVPVRIVIENLKEHGYNPSEFFLEIGYGEFYKGSVVLDSSGIS
jgi:hypothetical protein